MQILSVNKCQVTDSQCIVYHQKSLLSGLSTKTILQHSYLEANLLLTTVSPASLLAHFSV
jgi:hypothetical protein